MAPVDPLAPDRLYHRCDPAELAFDSTAELEPLEVVLGQDRALAALRFGIGMRHDDYHLFALGPPGVGKHVLVRRLLEQRAGSEPVPPDWCYVHNFAEPHRPHALRLPAGRGARSRPSHPCAASAAPSGPRAGACARRWRRPRPRRIS